MSKDDWKTELRETIQKARQHKSRYDNKDSARDSEKFITERVICVFKELKEELEGNGRKVTLTQSRHRASIEVWNHGKAEFGLQIRCRHGVAYPVRQYSYGNIFSKDGEKDYFRKGLQDYSIWDISQEEIREFFLKGYLRVLREGINE
jgi:hypothetical protein